METPGEEPESKADSKRGSVGKEVAEIKEKVNGIIGKLETYEAVSGAKVEIEEREKERRAKEIADAIKKKEEVAPETKPPVSDKAEKSGGIFGGLGVFSDGGDDE